MVYPPAAFNAQSWWNVCVRTEGLCVSNMTPNKLPAAISVTVEWLALLVRGMCWKGVFKSQTKRQGWTSVFDSVTEWESGVVKHLGWEEEMSLLILERDGSSALPLTPTLLWAATGSFTADCETLLPPLCCSHTQTVLIDSPVSHSLWKANSSNHLKGHIGLKNTIT